MRVLVTGSGYLGAHIAERFRARGDEVRLLTLALPSDMQQWAHTLESVHIGDVTDPAVVARACSGCDAVVHTAALNAAACERDDEAALRINGYGTANVVERAAEAGVSSLVYLSTFHVYGPVRTAVIDEETPCFPVGSYGSTHQVAESFLYRAVAKGRLKGTVLRLANGYGAPLFASADCWMLAANDFARRAVREGRVVLGSSGVQRRDFVAVTDVARAVEHFADTPASTDVPVVCIGGGTTLSIRELAHAVARVRGEMTGETVAVEAPDPGDEVAAPFTYDASRAASLGFSPRADLDETIRELLAFVEEHPHL